MEAFRVLYEQYQPILFRHVLFQTRDADASHDIVQETFIRVWEHRARIDPRLSFPAYLMRISGNIIRDESRRRRRRDMLGAEIGQPETSESDDPLNALDARMLEEELTAAITDLPDKCRAVFLLSRIEGKSNGEIATMCGTSVRTVEHQISHALDVLRKCLSRHLEKP
jgi:RNA polymerase sigma-70 factor, ECF subfamily